MITGTWSSDSDNGQYLHTLRFDHDRDSSGLSSPSVCGTFCFTFSLSVSLAFFGPVVILNIRAENNPFYVYVTTWSTVDYTSVTSIMHCRPCCNKLISWLSQTWSVTAKRIGVGHVALRWSEFIGESGKMLSTWQGTNCSERVGHIGSDCSCSLNVR